jgi:predicted RNase H-like HicB family nuclease
MKSIIQFQISKEGNYYTANGTDLPIITQAKTLDKLTKNIKEAVSLHLDGENLTKYNLSPKPSVLINFELPNRVYA